MHMKSLVLGTSAVDTLIQVPAIDRLEDDMMLWANNVTDSIGSTGAGKALALDVLGSETILLTDLGQDEYRTKVQSFFATTKVRLEVLETDKTTAHTNLMHSRGKRISVVTSAPSVIPPVHPEFPTFLAWCDVVFLNINQYCRDYIPLLVQSGKPIVVDIHDYDGKNPYHQDFIDIADILIASGVNLPDHETFLTDQINAGKELVVITKGTAGLVAMDAEGNRYELPAYTDFEFVDSNGAGDSFCAGLMLEYQHTHNWLDALRFGTVCGGVACTSFDLYHREFDRERIKNIVKKVSW